MIHNQRVGVRDDRRVERVPIGQNDGRQPELRRGLGRLHRRSTRGRLGERDRLRGRDDGENSGRADEPLAAHHREQNTSKYGKRKTQSGESAAEL
jgi:hypothetical protein